MEPIFETIRTYIDGQHEAMLKLWEELVNTESGSRNLEGVAAVTASSAGRWRPTGATSAGCATSRPRWPCSAPWDRVW